MARNVSPVINHRKFYAGQVDFYLDQRANGRCRVYWWQPDQVGSEGSTVKVFRETDWPKAQEKAEAAIREYLADAAV